MLALVVPAEIYLSLEALGTNVTSKRFEAGVFSAVGDQVGALAERFTTHLAFVGLFAYKIKHTSTDETQSNLGSFSNNFCNGGAQRVAKVPNVFLIR